MIPLQAGRPPQQAFLITVDTARVFESETMLRFLRSDSKSGLAVPAAKGIIIEVEVEWEDDVAALFDRSCLADAVCKQKRNALCQSAMCDTLRKAFLDDQKQIMTQIANAINAQNATTQITIEPENRSKYEQAYQILFNRAQRRLARQSSTVLSAAANRAVDGITGGDFLDGSVTHTDFQSTPLWEVDLGRQYVVTGIERNRTDCCSDRLSNVLLMTTPVKFDSDDLNAAIHQPTVRNVFLEGPAGPVSRVDASTPGRFVRVQLAGTNVLSLAEVKVFGHPAVLDIQPPTFSVPAIFPNDTSGCPSGSLRERQGLTRGSRTTAVYRFLTLSSKL